MSAGETDASKYLRRVRVDERDEESSLIGYQTPSGDEQVVTGDVDAPYTGPLVRSSANGIDGLVVEPDGANNRIAADSRGILWVRDIAGAAETFTVATDATPDTQLLVPDAAFVHAVRVITIINITAPRYVMFFKSSAVASNGDTPDWRGYIPPGTDATAAELGETFNPAFPALPGGGFVVAISTTPNTLTLPVTGEAYFSVQYSEPT